MAVASAPLRQTQASNAGLALGLAGLVALALACGVALAMGEIEALYVTLAALACIAILMDFRVGAVLLILMLPLSATEFFPHQLMGVTGLNPVNVLTVGTLASYLLRGRVAAPARLVPAPVLWLYIVPILIAGLLGMQYVDDIAPAFVSISYFTPVGYLRDEAVRPLLLVLVALLIGAAAARSNKPEGFITAIAVSACALALVEFALILVANVPIGALAAPRMRSFFTEIMGMHANGLGRVFVTAYALLLFVWWETKNPRVKAWLFVALGILSFGILFTFSRNAFLGFFLANGLFLLWKFNARTLGLALLGLAIASALAPGYVYDRITFGFATGSANVVSAGRIEGIWLPLLPEAWKSPLWGNGLSSILWSAPIVNGDMEPFGHPHNAYLEAVLDMGVIGLALLLAYYLHVWKGFRALGSNAYLTPEMRAFFQGAAAALIVYAVACGTGGSLRPSPENAFLWVAIGLMYGVLARKSAP
jgi:hypothetical protein